MFRNPSTFLDGIAGSLYTIDLQSGQKTLVCTPQVDGYGGRPAGCQSDKDGNIWVADMRLGLLKCSANGDYKQV